jgi:AcrR family transcriptional regulator
VIETGARRRAIDDIASRLFHTNGFAATSIRDIAKALDIQAASLYAHVASKDDLLWTIVEQAATALEEAADRAIVESAGGDAVELLAALVEAHVEVVTAVPERSSVFVTEWRHLSADRRAAIGDRRDAYERRFRDAIQDGVAGGVLRATDAAIAATFVLTALNGIATWYRPDGRLSADRVADHYVELALRSLLEDHR